MKTIKTRKRRFLVFAIFALAALLSLALIRWATLAERTYLVLDSNTLLPIPNVTLQVGLRPNNPNSAIERFFNSFSLKDVTTDSAGRAVVLFGKGQKLHATPTKWPNRYTGVNFANLSSAHPEYQKPENVEQVFFFF